MFIYECANDKGFQMGQMDQKRITALTISILIIACTITGILYINYQPESVAEKVHLGQLWLQDGFDSASPSIPLDGVWEFYPGVLAVPDALRAGEHRAIMTHIDVPGSWNDAQPHKGPSGSGTYRMIVHVPEDGLYGFETSTIRTSARLYLNGVEAVSIGRPSVVKSEYALGSMPKTIYTTSRDGQIELVVHVSSYDYRMGGILKSIRFGRAENIAGHANKNKAIDAFVVSICLAFSLYFFLSYIQRRNDRFLLHIGLAGIFLALYLSTLGEQLLSLVYEYNYYTRMRIQIFTMPMIALQLLHFAKSVFPSRGNNTVFKLNVWYLLLLMLFVFNTPDSRMFIPVGISQAMIGLGMIVTFVHIGWILAPPKNPDDSTGYMTIIFASLLSYWITMLLKMLFEMKQGQLPNILIIVTAFCIAMYASSRLQVDRLRAEELSEELLEQDRMKNSFLATTSHELRTPLHVMINLSRLLLEGSKGTLNLSQQEDLYYIQKESIRLSGLVDELMEATSIGVGNIALKLAAVDAAGLCRSVVDEMRILADDNKKIEFNCRIPDEFPAIEADSERFKQILFNLVHNAYKFTDSGSVTVEANVVDSMARFSVQDSGIGIARHQLARIFDSLYRIAPAKEDQGLGLGLSIAKRLVEQHGGTISVRSAENVGSTFTFTIPLHDSQTRANGEIQSVGRDHTISDVEELPVLLNAQWQSDEGQPLEQTDAPGILIVDDEESNQKVLRELLSSKGYRLYEAKNGKEALAIVRRGTVDLVVLDFMLPDMTGDIVCNEIRKEFSLSELPVLMITASGRRRDIGRSFECGANDFIKKPSDPDELKSRILSLLHMKASAEQALKKEFHYFYAQISPHFLYNTLNAIIGISYRDSDAARTALMNLGTYLRGKMEYYRQAGLIPLENELELVLAYLDIEKLRFPDRIKVDLDIDPDVAFDIPPLLLQPLVENAVRHGLEDGQKLSIRLNVQQDSEGSVMLSVEDNGPGILPEAQEKLLRGEGDGIGFTNVLKRVSLIRGASIHIDSAPGEGTRIIITFRRKES